MKAMLWKEFRENAKWGAIGFVTYALLLAYVADMPKFGNAPAVYCLDQSILVFTLFFAGGFGGALGLLQTVFERRRDQWAFLVHRPTSLSAIFLGKVIVGLALYAMATLIPFLTLATWNVLRPVTPAPFEYAMLFPGLAYLASGIPFYLAGIAAGTREARWTGSRAVILLAPILMSSSIVGGTASELWMALVGVSVSSAILGVATWSLFVNHGSYSKSYYAGRVTFACGLCCGFILICMGAIMGIELIWVKPTRQAHQDGLYRVFKDGKVYHVKRLGFQPTEAVDLDGNSFKVPDDQQSHQWSYINSQMLPGGGLYRGVVSSEVIRRNSYRFSHQSRFFHHLVSLEESIWYYVYTKNRIVGFDRMTKQRIGTFGENGFVHADRGLATPFRGTLLSPSTSRGEQGALGLFFFDTGIVRVNFGDLESSKDYTPEPGSAIVSATMIGDRKENGTGYDFDYSGIATMDSIQIHTIDGRPVFNLDLTTISEVYTMIAIYSLREPDRFLLMIRPDYQQNKDAGFQIPIIARTIDREGTLIEERELPPIVPAAATADDDHQWTYGAALPPAVFLILWTITGETSSGPSGTLAAVTAILCAFIALWRLRQSASGTGSRISVFLGIAALGLPGFLTFLALHETPAKERCLGCGNRRVVSRLHCEHCGAEFSALESDGTEIFDPVRT